MSLLPTEWRSPYHDPSNCGFSPQDVIGRENVSDLEVKWSLELGPSETMPSPHVKSYLGSVASVGVQTTPLVVEGTAYLADGGGTVYAVDGDAGSLLWSFRCAGQDSPNPRLTHTLNHRGGLLYVLANDTTLYGLDPGDGTPVWKIEGTGAGIPGSVGAYAGRAAPAFCGGSAIFGLAAQGVGAQGYEASARGFVASYDVASGRLLWRWYAVPPAEEGAKGWDEEAHKGNIAPYAGDWGSSDQAGGGSVWGTVAVDEAAGRVFFGTGNPDLFVYSDLAIPGPNLYTDCLVSLDAATGRMLWYHQTTPHDLLGWDVGWNTILTEIETRGGRRKAVIAGAKNNHVYVLDAETGRPVYEPVRIGENATLLNANRGNDADVSSTLKPGVYCPGHLGGINAPIAFAYNTIYAATQKVEQQAVVEEGTFRGKPMKTIKLRGTDSPRRSALYAIDAGSGEVRWNLPMQNAYQSAAVTVSGGVVYATDRGGVLYMADAETGRLIRSMATGGVGRAGLSVGTTKGGRMRMFLPVSGGTTNRLLCLGLKGD
ncbi:MAG: PQQ-binding-like beta-propeller repeat protein [Nitrososphaerota archaeon]|nr:PQQ-binding-like beta-propeller repeat protein [Nitrososphaerota archaeon]MDG6939762.1 PQQ-binding-like beta-propeller repeat protein [Nitrososphaerota archaeon]